MGRSSSLRHWRVSRLCTCVSRWYELLVRHPPTISSWPLPGPKVHAACPYRAEGGCALDGASIPGCGARLHILFRRSSVYASFVSLPLFPPKTIMVWPCCTALCRYIGLGTSPPQASSRHCRVFVLYSNTSLKRPLLSP